MLPEPEAESGQQHDLNVSGKRRRVLHIAGVTDANYAANGDGRAIPVLKFRRRTPPIPAAA